MLIHNTGREVVTTHKTIVGARSQSREGPGRDDGIGLALQRESHGINGARVNP